ncbi:DUF5996 family protein [Staphylococcus pseudintermedius]
MLKLAEWKDEKETLHRLAQILGKHKLAKVPFKNHNGGMSF